MKMDFFFSHKAIIQKHVTFFSTRNYYVFIKIPKQFQTAEVGGYLMFYDGDGESCRGRR